MPKRNRPGAKKTPAPVKEDPKKREQEQGLSKGAMAAERASAGIGTDDRDPDDWFRPTRRSS